MMVPLRCLAGMSSFTFLLNFILSSMYTNIGVSTLKLIDVIVPSYVITGDSAWLNCTYDLEKDNLYSIKWYKNNNEFYRFLPTDNPPWQIYNSEGIFLDLSKSSYGNISLSKTDKSTEGIYRCEVSAEAPTFQTVKGQRALKVYASSESTGLAMRPENWIFLLVVTLYNVGHHLGIL